MSHYDEKYFNWQKEVGKIGGYLNKFKFDSEVKETDVLMDFGCGGGYLLDNFTNTKKIGFEINKSAWNEIISKGITAVDDFNSIHDDSIDCIISNHAMEHVPSPIEVLKNLFLKLKKGGKIILVIPCEQASEPGFNYKKGDLNQHLHTWTPMSFGNLATLAGFEVISCEGFQHQWTPNWKNDWNKPDFHQQCKEYAIKNNNLQIKLIATKL